MVVVAFAGGHVPHAGGGEGEDDQGRQYVAELASNLVVALGAIGELLQGFGPAVAGAVSSSGADSDFGAGRIDLATVFDSVREDPGEQNDECCSGQYRPRRELVGAINMHHDCLALSDLRGRMRHVTIAARTTTTAIRAVARPKV